NPNLVAEITYPGGPSVAGVFESVGYVVIRPDQHYNSNPKVSTNLG
ncbi:9231_t:CDS:1, partial [Racocetra persica]